MRHRTSLPLRPSTVARRWSLTNHLLATSQDQKGHAFNLFWPKYSLVQTTVVATLILGSICWAWGLSMSTMERYFFVAAATSFLTLIAAIALLELIPS